MASTWNVWTCSNHGIVRHTDKQYKCTRLDCSLKYNGYFKFDHETDKWQFQDQRSVLGSEIDLGPIHEKIIEHKSRAEYRLTLANQTDDELRKTQECLKSNVETHCIGPIFYSEIISALNERIKN